MALQTSGAISLSDIEGEFGGSPPTAISEYYGVAAGVPTSGTIDLADFYGTSKPPPAITYRGSLKSAGTTNSQTRYLAVGRVFVLGYQVNVGTISCTVGGVGATQIAFYTVGGADNEIRYWYRDITSAGNYTITMTGSGGSRLDSLVGVYQAPLYAPYSIDTLTTSTNSQQSVIFFSATVNDGAAIPTGTITRRYYADIRSNEYVWHGEKVGATTLTSNSTFSSGTNHRTIIISNP